MADERQKVRIEEHLKIKIGEAKNLQSRNHGSTLHRDVYCTVSLDQEKIFRTSTQEKTLCPFFGEEFSFEVPRRFRYLSIYVYDRDRHLKQDKVMGKVAIKREDLNKYHNKDHWFAIRPVDADSEVQGKILVEVTANPTQTFIKVVECCDLTLKNGCCDSYAQVTCTYSSSRKVTKRTKVKKKTTCPTFDEGFTFDQGEDDMLCEVCVGLWHDMGMGEDLFLGEVRIDLRRGDTSNWYYLQPRRNTSKTCSTPPGTRLSCDNSLGSLRLQVYYTADYVFSKEVYAPLRNLLLDSVNLQPITSSAVYILGEIVTSKMEAALPLVRIFMHNGQIVDIIQALANFEISKLTDPTTIFRGNTLVSKMMDEAMKLIGLNYLHTTLRPVINLIFVERKPCEIDPTRCYNIENNSTTETNLLNLIEYVQKVFDAIVDSAVHCPSLLCQIFHNLKECAIKYFPNNKEVRYSVISGFIFLRFFAPAILGPKLFQITNEQIDSQTNRTLTLISKTIQSLGNLVSARSVQQTCKESYMERVHKAFATDAHIQKLRQFLEIISASSNPNETSVNNTPVVLKEGIMIKRAQGRKRFGRKNFKERYFRLSTHDLIYSKSKNKEPLCCIPLTDILAVEQLNESSFKMKNMFQIIQKERTLYIQANNCVEQKGWLDLLTKLCQSNNNRLQRYHPAAFLNGHWFCCNGCSVDTPGCEAVINGNDSLTSNQLIDNCCDLERIYSLIIEHYDRLLAYRQRCEQQAVYTGDVCIRPNCIIDDIQSTFKTIQQLQEIIYQLQHKHFMYQKLKQTNIKYGSKQAPIGDDNYLNLAARLSLDPTFARKCIDS